MTNKYYNINEKTIAHSELLRNKDFKKWLDQFESLTIKAVLKEERCKKKYCPFCLKTWWSRKAHKKVLKGSE